MKYRGHILLRLIRSFLLSFVSLTSAPAALAQTGSSEVDTIVIAPLSLLKTVDLNFGNLIAGATAGTAVVDTDGNRSVTGGTTEAGGTVAAAVFLGYGDGGMRVKIDGPTGTHTLTRVGGGATMTMRDMTMDADNVTSLGRGNSGQYTIDITGLITIRVGGTLDVGANQQSGTYVGTFDVSVNYF